MTDAQPRIITRVEGAVGHLTFSNPEEAQRHDTGHVARSSAERANVS